VGHLKCLRRYHGGVTHTTHTCRTGSPQLQLVLAGLQKLGHAARRSPHLPARRRHGLPRAGICAVHVTLHTRARRQGGAIRPRSLHDHIFLPSSDRPLHLHFDVQRPSAGRHVSLTAHEKQNLEIQILLRRQEQTMESEGKSGVYERIRDPKWLSGKGEGEGQWSSGLCDCFSDCRKVSCCLVSIA